MTKYKVPKFLYVLLFLVVVADLVLTVWLIISKKKETTPTQATGGQTQATGGQIQATGGQTQATGGQIQATGGQIQATGGQIQATGGQIQDDDNLNPLGESDLDKCTKYHTNCTKNPLEIDECRKYCKNLDDPDKKTKCRFSYHCIKEWLKQCQDCTGKCLISNPIEISKSSDCTDNTLEDKVTLARDGNGAPGTELGKQIVNGEFCGMLDDHGHLDKEYCTIDWESDIDYTLCENSSDCSNYQKGANGNYCCPPKKDSDFLKCCSDRSRTPAPSEPGCGLEDEGGCP